MNDLLPINATKQEKALALSAGRISSVPVPIGDLWSPFTCPAGILPWLAWSLSVEPWNSNWTEQQKRNAIDQSISVHRSKGTIGALRRALEAVGYECVVNENTGTAYTFTIAIDVTNGAANESAYSAAEEIGNKVKNARSHLISVGSLIKQTGMGLNAVELDGLIIEVKPS